MFKSVLKLGVAVVGIGLSMLGVASSLQDGINAMHDIDDRMDKKRKDIEAKREARRRDNVIDITIDDEDMPEEVSEDTAE